MYMTSFIKNLLSLLFNIGVIALVGVLVFLLTQWAAAFFLVPAGIVQIIGFIIFLFAVYRIAMLLISYTQSLKNL